MNSLKDFGRGLKEKIQRRKSDALASSSNSNNSTPSASATSSVIDSQYVSPLSLSSGKGSIGFGSDPSSATEEKHRINQLSSKSTHEQLDAMRWLVAESNSKVSLFNMGRKVANGDGGGPSESDWIAENFLPTVVKLLATKHPELKRLVYIFLVRHAEAKPDDALMAVNEIQKGLNDANNAQARVMSVRVLSSIRVQDIVPITFVVIKNAVFDPNPVVRKAGVLGLAKLHSFNRDMEDDLFEILLKVLDSEPSPAVLGAACEVFNLVSPDRLEVIHWSFRKICKLVADMDEWSQVAAVNLLHRYARANFVNPNRKSGEEVEGSGGDNQDSSKQGTVAGSMKESIDDFYGDGGGTPKAQQQQQQQATTEGSDARKNPEQMITDDHRLLLRNSWPLLQSRNSAVVMAVAALQFDFAPSYEHHRCAKALVFCMRSTRSSSEYVILNNVATFAYKYPAVFSSHFTGFFVRASDPLHVKCLKLNVLTEIIKEDQIPELLKELQAYLRDNEMSFVSNAIFALGRCAQKYPKIKERILKSLMVLSTHSSDEVSSNSVQVILGIAQSRPDIYIEQIAKLIKRYKLLVSPKSRMGVLWLSSCHLTLHSRLGKTEEQVVEKMGKETFDKLSDLAYEAARLATLQFIGESEEVKLQTLNSLAKLSIHGIEKVKSAFDYVIALAKCDPSYNVRDRSRLFGGLLSEENKMEGDSLPKKIILASETLKPVSSSMDESKNSFSVGSLSHLVNHCAPGYQPLPEFRETPTSSTLRDRNAFNSEKANKARVSFSNGKQHSNGRTVSEQPTGGSPLDTFYSDEEDSGEYSDSYSYSYSETEDEEENK